jgi:hypothetical protein
VRLPGRLRATTLGDLLGALYRDRATGVLELVEERGVSSGRSHRVFLRGGLVEDVDTGLRLDRLGELLRAQGFLGEEAQRWLGRRLAESPSRRAGSLLVDAGMVTKEVVSAALRQQLRARLDAVFRVMDALVRFHVPRPRLLDAGRPLPLSPREFLHGRPRQRDRAPGASGPKPAGANPDPGHRNQPPPGQAPSPKRLDPVRVRALATLGLESGADQKSVQRAFRRLAASVHPDRYPRASADERARLIQRFAELSAAYHALLA